jgi:glycosyltransferase involved in cell wall biosynthesis
MKVSIVTPVYNQINFIQSCIDSINAQSYTDWEHIIIDGGSTDGTWEIIQNNHHHFKYSLFESDEGPAFALNKGFEQATGDIFYWLNADDMLPPWALSVVIDIFSNLPSINWITGTPAIWSDDFIERLIYKERLTRYSYLSGHYKWIQQESTFFRRSLFDRAGSYISESYRFMYDLELWSRFFLIDEVYHVQAIIGGFRPHLSNNSRLYMKECYHESRYILQKYRLSYGFTCKDLFPCLIELIKRNQFLLPLNVDKILDKLFRNFLIPMPYANILTKCSKSHSWLISKTLLN